jgi:Cu2+-exporting ATPase
VVTAEVMPPAAAALDAPRADRLVALDDPVEQESFTRFETDAAGRRIGVSALRISGITCAACAGIIEGALARVDGVVGADVQAAAARAQVRWDAARTSPSAIVAAIEAAGYGALPDAGADAARARRDEGRRMLWRLFVASFCMMQVMMVAVPVYVAAPGELDAALLGLLNRSAWLFSLPVLFFSAGPFFRGAWIALRERRIGMDVPVSLGIAVTFVASTGAAFDPAGPFGAEVYFDSLTMFVAFLLCGRWLEMRARHRVAATLEAAMARLPSVAQRVGTDGSVQAVPIARLAAGDRVRVAAGEAFPADGVLEGDSAQVDESMLTGESEPVAKHAGDALAAGTANRGAPAVMRVERVGADTRHAAIVALMQQALATRPSAVREADRWAGPFLWGVLVLAAGAAAWWSVVDPSRAVWVAVSVLIVTCPCALSLATPSALLAAASAFARRGLLLRRLDAIEVLAQVRTAVFDKTGTLTQDRLEVVSVEPEDAQARGLAVALAAWSAHPASRAIHALGGAADVALADVREVPGEGLQARRGAQSLALGRRAGRPGVWFTVDGEPRLQVTLREAVRHDAAAALARLRTLGVRTAVLSGDSADRVDAVADRLAIDDRRAGASPADKLVVVQAARGEGRVLMVGDGLNDAPVLASADVSFAFAHGAAVNRLHADAVLLGEGLAPVADAVLHARRTMRVVRQNLAWSAVYNAACIPLALAGWLPPWAAGLGMAGSSLFVVLNAARLARLPEAR